MTNKDCFKSIKYDLNKITTIISYDPKDKENEEYFKKIWKNNERYEIRRFNKIIKKQTKKPY